ncbi:SDR family oxidoreductase [Neisseriaceae bacterium TC5R-5]|nr:SDR family oxidoreductase [Neisseriaceae bacterium TC5R-5]
MRTLLIIGAGDVVCRALPYLGQHWRVLASYRSTSQANTLRQQGVTPIYADLDHPSSLRRLANLADDLLISTPPANEGRQDKRMRRLLYALEKGSSIPQRLVYISTSGVYGDAAGGWLNESTPPRPQNERAWRRLDAEQVLRQFAKRWHSQLSILRAPGIYADERLPLSRFYSQAPLIHASEDSYSNHIHADDLARLCIAALQRHGGGIRVYNACDDLPLAISDWYRLLAATLQLTLPPILSRAEVQAQVSPGLWSYMMESRRLDNRRLYRELIKNLRWPNVRSYLTDLGQDPARLAAILATTRKIS